MHKYIRSCIERFEILLFQEVKYRRIKFIMEPWYDDHFDIPTEKQRLGKTLTMVARLEGDTLLSRGSQLVGWGFYEKFDKGLSLIKTWLESEGVPAVTQSEVSDVSSILRVALTDLVVVFAHLTCAPLVYDIRGIAGFKSLVKSHGSQCGL